MVKYTGKGAGNAVRKIKDQLLIKYREHLKGEEKAKATVQKYVRDVGFFRHWLGKEAVDKEKVILYKTHLTERYAPASVNSAIASLNGFFAFAGWHDFKIKGLKIQKQIFLSQERELTKKEYLKLLMAAKQTGNKRLFILMQTICSTGIRISELPYITAESVRKSMAEIACKGKIRKVFLPGGLCDILEAYIREVHITAGPVFVTKRGKPLDRSNICSDMKKLCAMAGVDTKKVFPHNFRHLFARTHYSKQKDVLRLADILGHANVNTTRIYTMESGEEHRRQIQELDLLFPPDFP